MSRVWAKFLMDLGQNFSFWIISCCLTVDSEVVLTRHSWGWNWAFRADFGVFWPFLGGLPLTYRSIFLADLYWPQRGRKFVKNGRKSTDDCIHWPRLFRSELHSLTQTFPVRIALIDLDFSSKNCIEVVHIVESTYVLSDPRSTSCTEDVHIVYP